MTFQRYIEHATRFSCFAEKLRQDVELANTVLAEEWDWRDECELIMKMEKHGF